MFQHRSPMFLRNFYAFLTSLGVLFFATVLFAQVPTNGASSKNIAVAEGSIPTGHTIVKVMASESPIPFGALQASGNLTVLDMKGNDQEFGRSFKFKILPL
jgi:hypothetical protein